MDDFIIAGICDAGTKCATNQDAVFAGRTESYKGDTVFAILCDGMGGTEAGDLASATIISAFRKWFYQKCDLGEDWEPVMDDINSEWNTLIFECNRNIIDYGRQNGITLGSTIVVELITRREVLIMNVGDSRAYHVNNGLTKLSKDHSVVGKEIEAGILTEEQAKSDPRNNVLTQCIGIKEIVTPFSANYQTDLGCYIICSDGFYNRVSGDELVSLIHAATDKEQLEAALHEVLSRDRARQERDDISAIAVLITDSATTKSLEP